jgi:hypothetical protein
MSIFVNLGYGVGLHRPEDKGCSKNKLPTFKIKIHFFDGASSRSEPLGK